MSNVLFQQFNLSDGLNIGVNQYLNKPGECREALNCDFSEVGTLQRHLGYPTYGDDLGAADILGIYDFKTSAGSIKWLAVYDEAIYSDESETWTSRQAGLTADSEATFATHLDTCIMANGVDAPLKSTDGTTWASLGGSPPTAKYAVTFDNKVYMLNNSGATSRMRWSDDGTIETWTATNIQDVTTNIGIGDQITGGTVNNNSLIIFKNYSTWKWDTYELRTLHSSVGCRAPKSIATIDDWTFWVSHRGAEASNGGKPFRISKPVQAFFNAISDITAPIGWANDNFWYVFIGTVTVGKIGTITNCLMIYDYDNNVWSYKPMDFNVARAAILTTSGDVRHAYLGSDSGQVYKFKSGNNDNGAPIPFKWIGGPQVSGASHLQKNYDYLYVFLDRTAKYGIEVFYSIDFGDFESLGTASEVVSELPFPSGTSGHNIRISFQSNLTTDQQKILGYTCLGSVASGRLGSVQ